MTRSLLYRLAAPLALAVVIAACGATTSDSSSSTTPSSPSSVPVSTSNTPTCAVTVTGLPSSVPSPTGHYTFTLTTASSCSWTAHTDVSWADVSPGSGSGSATPTLNVSSNDVRNTRTATVIVNGQSFSVVQQIAPCEYSVTPTFIAPSPSGGVTSVTLYATDGCSWTATSNASWIRPRVSSGTGSKTVQFDVDPDTTGTRQAVLTVAGLTVNVTQDPQP